MMPARWTSVRAACAASACVAAIAFNTQAARSPQEIMRARALPAVPALPQASPARRAPAAAQTAAAAAAARAGAIVQWDAALGTPATVRGADVSAGRVRVAPGAPTAEVARAAVCVMAELADVYSVRDAAAEFAAQAVTVDGIGYRHVRLDQRAGGLPVFGAGVLVHFDAAGAPYAVNGRYVPDIPALPPPVLDGTGAVTRARADLAARQLPPATLSAEPALIVYAFGSAPRLAYALALSYANVNAPGRWRYFVDARDGGIILAYNDIKYTPGVNGWHTNVTGNVLTREGGHSVTNVGWFNQGLNRYYLFNSAYVWCVTNVARTGYTDTRSYAWRSTPDWGASDRAEVSLAQAFQAIQAYWRTRFNRWSFDGLNRLARANVHYGNSYNNAFWDGNAFNFGDGDGVLCASLAVFDVAAHEYTHAVIERTADLIYYEESGALTESLCDIFAACTEFAAQPDGRAAYPSRVAGAADWLMGEDCWLQDTAVRDLRNPANVATVGSGGVQPSRYKGTHWYTLGDDNGGVHYNGGPQSFFFYLLCEGGAGTNDGLPYQVAGIGVAATEQIAHRALAAYYLPWTDYAAARQAWLAAAMDLNTNWVRSVQQAWSAVGVNGIGVTPEADAVLIGPAGGPFEASVRAYTFAQHDLSGAIAWQASNSAAWLAVAPASGMLAPGSAAAIALDVTAATNLAPGTYEDTLTIHTSGPDLPVQRRVVLHVLPPPAQYEPLDREPGWAADAAWAFGVPRGAYGDPSAAHSGSAVYGYNLQGPYEKSIGAPRWLTAGPFDCRGIEGAQFAFWRWLDADNGVFDQAAIQLSVDGGAWTTLWHNIGVVVHDTFWQPMVFDLSGCVDGRSNVLVRWGMGPTRGPIYTNIWYGGWNIDDIGWYGTPRAALQVAPAAGLAVRGYPGGPFAPSATVYTLCNESGTALGWTAGHTAAWLDVAPASGALPPGSSTTVVVRVTAAAASLATGSYTGTLAIADLSNGVTRTRQTILAVRPQPGSIAVHDSIAPHDDRALPFGVVPAGANATAVITITNTSAAHSLDVTRIAFDGWYQEDFSGGDAYGWAEDVPDNWSVVKSAYRATSPNDDFMTAMYQRELFDDVSVQAHCWREGLDVTAQGIVLRASDDFDAYTRGSGYMFYFGKGQVSPSGVVASVYKQIDGVVSDLIPYNEFPAQGLDTVLTASAEGSRLLFYLGGVLAAACEDTALTNGRIGLCGYTAPQQGIDTVFFFDDVRTGPPVTPDIRPLAAPVARGPFALEDLPNLPATLAPGAALRFTARYQPQGYGASTQRVIIASTDADEPEVPVTLSGSVRADFLEVMPAGPFVATGPQGGPFAPASMQYLLVNGFTPQTWTAVWQQAWVTATPAGGTVAGGATTAVTVHVTGAAASLTAGIYSTRIVFSNLTSSAAIVRTVSLHVSARPAAVVTPAMLSVTNQIGGTATAVCVVSNAGTAQASLSFRVWTKEYGYDGGAVLNTVSAAASTPANAAALRGFEPDLTAPHQPGELLVRFAPRVPAARRASALAACAAPGAAAIAHEFALVPGLTLVKLADDGALPGALAALAADDAVIYASPNYRLRTFDVQPNDTYFSDLWGLHNTEQIIIGSKPGADIDAPAAWSVTTGSHAVIVAVIDTGIDYGHPDLAANMWRNSGEIAGNGIDDDGNGLVDDVRGYDFVNEDADPMDDSYHGTHCAGTIGAVGNNNRGVVGVCWCARLMACKAFDANGYGTTAAGLRAIEYAVRMGAQVINCSWGNAEYVPAMKDMIAAAAASNIVFCIATGNAYNDNDVWPIYPASYDCDNIIAVLATDPRDTKSLSNYGATRTDLAAPGIYIYSTSPGNKYHWGSGTSFAAPHVSGAAALLLSLNPFLTHAEIKRMLMSTVDPVLPGVCVSGGRMNLPRALACVTSTWLRATPASAGPLAPGAAAPVTAQFAAGALLPGVYTGAVFLTGTDSASPLVRVPATMTILPDALDVLPTAPVQASGMLGEYYTPAAWTYVVTNRSGAGAGWSLAHAPAWLDVTPAGGLLAPGAAMVVSAALNAAAYQLPPARHAGAVLFSNTVTGIVLTRQAALSISDLPATNIYTFSMDTDPGWTTQGQWAYGKPAGNSGDPTLGATGTNIYGYNLNGAYANNMPAYYLTTKALNFSQWRNVRMRFQRWLRVDASTKDRATIDVSTDGVTWVSVWSNSPFTLREFEWRPQTHDVPAAAQQSNVFIRWGMGPTDGSVVDGGWNFDDLVFEAVPADLLVLQPQQGFSARGYAGGPFVPTSAVYTVRNTGAHTQTWHLSTPVWLTAAPAAGALPPGSVAAVSVALVPGVAAYGPGLYTGTLALSNAVSGAVMTRDARLDVLTGAGPLVLTDSIAPGDDAALPFGPIPLGASRNATVTLTNRGAVYPVVVSNMALTYGYHEDFNDNAAQDWRTDEQSAWEISGGAFRAVPVEGGFAAANYLGATFGDFAVQATCWRSGFGGASVGLAMRTTPDFNPGVAGSGYLFMITLNQYYSVWWLDDLAAIPLQNWTYHGGLSTGTNTLTVSARGTTLSFFVNGTLLWMGSDLSYPTGGVALCGYNNGGSTPTTHYFDDVIVGEALESGVADGWLNPAFALSNTVAFPYAVPPGGSITAHLAYRPARTGANASRLRVSSTDAQAPLQDVALSGSGTASAATIAAARAMGHGAAASIGPLIVLATNNLSAAGYSIAAQDDTGGVMLHWASAGDAVAAIAAGLAPGTAVLAHGTNVWRSGVYELLNPTCFTLLPSALPEALAIDITDLQNHAPTGELCESMLCRIKGVAFDEAGALFAAGHDYTVRKAAQAGVVAINNPADPLAGMPVYTGLATIVGILSQHSATEPGTNDTTGYRLLPLNVATPSSPFVDITNAGGWVSHDTAAITLAGTNNAIVAGGMAWSNALAGAGGALAAATAWSVPGVPLAVGVNVISMRGTNAFGEWHEDRVSITRGGAGTGAPFINITNVNAVLSYDATSATIGGTNNQHVAGGMWWSNSLTKAGGVFAAGLGWTRAGIALGVGANPITVGGTNALGARASDLVVLTRGGFGTGAPFLLVTNRVIYAPCHAATRALPGTNTLHVAGGMWWSNTTAGAGGAVSRAYEGLSFNADAPLLYGSNAFAVCGSNLWNVTRTDSFIVYRQTLAEDQPAIASNALIFPAAGSELTESWWTNIIWNAAAVYDLADGAALRLREITLHDAVSNGLVAVVASNLTAGAGACAWAVPPVFDGVTNTYLLRFQVVDSSALTNEMLFANNPFTVVPEPVLLLLAFAGLLALTMRREGYGTHMPAAGRLISASGEKHDEHRLDANRHTDGSRG